jgi:hypothetical protein
MPETPKKMASRHRVDIGEWRVDLPKPPVVGEVFTFEGVNKRFRIAEVSERDGVFSMRLEPEDLEMVD